MIRCLVDSHRQSEDLTGLILEQLPQHRGRFRWRGHYGRDDDGSPTSIVLTEYRTVSSRSCIVSVCMAVSSVCVGGRVPSQPQEPDAHTARTRAMRRLRRGRGVRSPLRRHDRPRDQGAEPTRRLTYEELERRLRAPGNGRDDIYQVDASDLEDARDSGSGGSYRAAPARRIWASTVPEATALRRGSCILARQASRAFPVTAFACAAVGAAP